MNDAWRLIRELWSDRSRIGLVALGVLWGTLSMSVLLAFGSSMSESTRETADSFGVDLLRVYANATSLSHAGMPAGRSLSMRVDDVEPLRSIPGVRSVAYEYSRGGGSRVKVDGAPVPVSVAGVSAGFGELRSHDAMPGGRFINARDHEESRRVCFLGNRIAMELFGSVDVVGRSLELDGTPLQVVGVGPPRITASNYNGADRDKLSMPAETFKELQGWPNISFAWIGLQPGADKQAVLDELYRRLGARLGFAANDRNALEIQDYMEVREMLEGILQGNRIFTLLVGVLGLLVSIVGVTNVMLALVEERSRELGIQLALGMPPRQLALERVVEGVLMTLMGGLGGLAMSIGLFAGLSAVPMSIEVVAYLGRPRLDLGLTLSVLTILMLAGAGAGWLPARRAIRLDPAQVLRDE